MESFLQTLAVSGSGMDAQARRLRHIAENIANADTPGYRRKTIAFEAVASVPGTEGPATAVRTGPVRLDPRPLPMIHDPGHAMSDESGQYEGSNVDVIIEVADAREAQRSYEANLRMFDQTRQMSQALLELLRR
jgi:flagellar basal-body rod protein FlgC